MGQCGSKQEEKRGAYNPAYAVKKDGRKELLKSHERGCRVGKRRAW